MWLVLLAAVAYDWMKPPIDRLYFQNPWRPLIGVRNALVDAVFWRARYSVSDYPGLWTLEAHWRAMRDEFQHLSERAPKHFFHDLDPWFPTNANYYYYNIDAFPNMKRLIERIPCVEKNSGVLAVMDGPGSLPAHRAESNLLLRYQLTLEGDGESVLITKHERHAQRPGKAFIFDHGCFHAVDNVGAGRRVVLILDIKRLHDIM